MLGVGFFVRRGFGFSSFVALGILAMGTSRLCVFVAWGFFGMAPWPSVIRGFGFFSQGCFGILGF